eukprot:Hpha_TRINITY_DN2365_c0_g1::TRINITY_DN2365_c0_g1_i1::g.502::m.502
MCGFDQYCVAYATTGILIAAAVMLTVASFVPEWKKDGETEISLMQNLSGGGGLIAMLMVSAAFDGMLAGMRVCAASGDAKTQDVPPPCPGCMIAAVIQFVMPLVVVCIVGTSSGTPSYGLYLGIVATILCFVGLLLCIIAYCVEGQDKEPDERRRKPSRAEEFGEPYA